MYQAERGVFELRQGRPLYVTDAGAGTSGSGSPKAAPGALVVAVEGSTPETLAEVRRLARGPMRLVVTRHRARAMGFLNGGNDTTAHAIAPEPHAASNGHRNGSAPHVGLALAEGTALDEVLRLAATPGTWEGLDPVSVSLAEAGGLDLARLGRLIPAVLAAPADRATTPALHAAIEQGAVLTVTTQEIAALTARPRLTVTHVSDATVPLEEAEQARFVLFREANGLSEHLAILIGERERWPDPLPVRVHSACLTGDLFGSLRCDCGEQLRRSLGIFANQGGGVLLYLSQEGRSIGLGNKLRAYALQAEGLDTVDADCVLGFGADERRYDVAVDMLRHLDIERVQLLTNNPEKIKALESGGIQVLDRRPLHGTLNPHNLPYVRAKVQRAGHWLNDMLSGAPSSD